MYQVLLLLSWHLLPTHSSCGYNRGDVRYSHLQVSGHCRSCCTHWRASQSMCQHHAHRGTGCLRLPSMRCASQASAQCADRLFAALGAPTADDQPVQLHCPGKYTAPFCLTHGMPCISSDSNVWPRKASQKVINSRVRLCMPNA
jgi:hypothetical protein